MTKARGLRDDCLCDGDRVSSSNHFYQERSRRGCESSEIYAFTDHRVYRAEKYLQPAGTAQLNFHSHIGLLTEIHSLKRHTTTFPIIRLAKTEIQAPHLHFNHGIRNRTCAIQSASERTAARGEETCLVCIAGVFDSAAADMGHSNDFRHFSRSIHPRWPPSTCWPFVFWCNRNDSQRRDVPLHAAPLHSTGSRILGPVQTDRSPHRRNDRKSRLSPQLLQHPALAPRPESRLSSRARKHNALQPHHSLPRPILPRAQGNSLWRNPQQQKYRRNKLPDHLHHPPRPHWLALDSSNLGSRRPRHGSRWNRDHSHQDLASSKVTARRPLGLPPPQNLLHLLHRQRSLQLRLRHPPNLPPFLRSRSPAPIHPFRLPNHNPLQRPRDPLLRRLWIHV